MTYLFIACSAIMGLFTLLGLLPTLVDNPILLNFTHANVFHFLANACCLLSIKNKTKWYSYLLALCFASCGFYIFKDIPASGLSGIIYFLIALYMPTQFKQAMFILIFLFVWCCIPNVAWHIHLFCFGSGLATKLVLWLKN
jgi:hypothetical protein